MKPYEQMDAGEREAFDAVDVPRERAEQDGKCMQTWLMQRYHTDGRRICK